MLEQHFEFVVGKDGTKTYTVTPEFTAAVKILMEESVTLSGVRPMKISEFVPGAFVTAEDVARCGPLLVD